MSIFGTQENYALLDDKEIASYMKFPLYQKEQGRRYRNNPFNKDNFPYDPQTDAFTCPLLQGIVKKKKFILHIHQMNTKK